MGEDGRFDPMLLESRLPYLESLVKTPLVVATVVAEHPACKEVTEAGAQGSSLMDPRLSPEHGDSGVTQVGEEHGRGTLTGIIGNGRTIVLERQQEERPSLLNPPTQCSRKRKNWSAEETDLLFEAVDAEKAKPRSRLDSEPFWEGVAKRVPGRTGKECGMRMEMLKKSYIAVKEYCDEEKQFGELKGAEFGKMKLATQIMERWYYRIRDRYPPKPSKKPRGLGRCSGSDVV